MENVKKVHSNIIFLYTSIGGTNIPTFTWRKKVLVVSVTHFKSMDILQIKQNKHVHLRM